MRCGCALCMRTVTHRSGVSGIFYGSTPPTTSRSVLESRCWRRLLLLELPAMCSFRQRCLLHLTPSVPGGDLVSLDLRELEPLRTHRTSRCVLPVYAKAGVRFGRALALGLLVSILRTCNPDEQKVGGRCMPLPPAPVRLGAVKDVVGQLSEQLVLATRPLAALSRVRHPQKDAKRRHPRGACWKYTYLYLVGLS